ncbi:MAG TPA: hypothetical protein DCL60_00175 [Armatimonadetes bacterium]|nr:hypothetical protein [Armatimonadota bacterium]
MAVESAGCVCIPDVHNEELVAFVELRRRQMKLLSAELVQAEAMLLQRMKEREATLLDAGRYTVKLIPNIRYTYNMEAISRLREMVPQDEYSKAVTMEPKISKLGLNRLSKLGGEIKKIIDGAVKCVEGTPRLAIEERDSANS